MFAGFLNLIRKKGAAKRSFVPNHAELHKPDALYRDCIFENSYDQPTTEMLSKSHIPLLRVLHSSIEITSFHKETEKVPLYVAISHVRSEGLGNMEGNAISRCQLSRLQDLVNNLYTANCQPVPFWIDTACIPHEQPGKSMAFELLDKVYRRAGMVLALDMSIQNICMSSAREDLKTIQQSAWAQRLWTIREDALANCIKLQFKDAP